MIEFLEQYAPQIAVIVAIVGPLMPLIHKRIVSDRNMIKVFDNVKELASKVQFKESDIKNALIKVDVIQDKLNKTIDDYQNIFNDKMKIVDQKITNFMESDLYQKMLNGLGQLDELKSLLQNKDTTIQELGTVIKDLKQSLLEIKNKLG
jgi:hypothetical protein